MKNAVFFSGLYMSYESVFRLGLNNNKMHNKEGVKTLYPLVTIMARTETQVDNPIKNCRAGLLDVFEQMSCPIQKEPKTMRKLIANIFTIGIMPTTSTI